MIKESTNLLKATKKKLKSPRFNFINLLKVTKCSHDPIPRSQYHMRSIQCSYTELLPQTKQTINFIYNQQCDQKNSIGFLSKEVDDSMSWCRMLGIMFIPVFG